MGALQQQGNECFIEDSLDELAGKLDMGLATVNSASMSLIYGMTVACFCDSFLTVMEELWPSCLTLALARATQEHILANLKECDSKI